MAHSTLSLMIPPSVSISSLLTCTPIRLATRPSTGPLQISSSDEIHHFDDPTNVSSGSLADIHSLAGYEPKDLAEKYNLALVRPLFFHRPSMTSTCDSAESIATSAPESDLDDEQIRHMLASPLYLLEREASADRSRVYHSFTENSVISSSHFRESTGRPCSEGEYGETRCVVFKQKEVESRSTFQQTRSFFRTSTGSRKTTNL